MGGNRVRMISQVHIMGKDVQSNVFVSRGVVVDADVGFNYLVGWSTDDLWHELYRKGFWFDIVHESHDEEMTWKNAEFARHLKLSRDHQQELELERRMRNVSRTT